MRPQQQSRGIAAQGHDDTSASVVQRCGLDDGPVARTSKSVSGFTGIAGMRTKPWPADRNSAANGFIMGEQTARTHPYEWLIADGLKMTYVSAMQIDMRARVAIGDFHPWQTAFSSSDADDPGNGECVCEFGDGRHARMVRRRRPLPRVSSRIRRVMV